LPHVVLAHYPQVRQSIVTINILTKYANKRKRIESVLHLRSASTCCVMVSKEIYMRNMAHTYLRIVSLEPILIKAMTPKVAAAVIRCVGLPAVDTLGRMGARLALRSGENRRVCVGHTHSATSGQSTVVFFPVRTVTDRTFDLRSMTSRCGVAPPPTPDAKGSSRIGPGSSKHGNVSSKLNGTGNESLSLRTTNRVTSP
jgi:hypothetical protein